MKDVLAETLVDEMVTKVRRGNIVYADNGSYDALIFYGLASEYRSRSNQAEKRMH